MKTVDFVGSVSWGTMRAQDVLPAIMGVLRDYHPQGYDAVCDAIAEDLGVEYDDLDSEHDAWYSGEMSYIINETAWDAMGEIAPKDHYFGAHVGDGADYGFWPVEFLD